MIEIIESIEKNRFENVTKSFMDPLYGCEVLRGPNFSRTSEPTTISDYFEQIFNESLLLDIVEILNSKKTHKDDEIEGYGRNVDADITISQLLAYHSIEFDLSIKDITVDKYFETYVTPISRLKFFLIRKLTGFLDIEAIRKICVSLSNSFHCSWKTSSVLSFDELLSGYISRNMEFKRFMARKPHKIGHLFYLLVDKASFGNGHNYYYVCSVYVEAGAAIKSPSAAAKNVLFTSIGDRKPLIVFDGAFCTDQLINYLQDKKYYYLISGIPTSSRLFKFTCSFTHHHQKQKKSTIFLCTQFSSKW